MAMPPFIDPRIDPTPHPGTPPAVVTESPDELVELHRLCREGRLYEVEAWIKAGRPLQLAWQGPQGRRFPTALTIARETDRAAAPKRKCLSACTTCGDHQEKEGMTMDRREFLRKATALSVSVVAVVRGVKVWAKGLPSDPGGAAGGGAGPELMVLPPFEKTNPFPLDRALLDRKSSRAFADRALAPDEVSRLLWATTGVNREDGHRTTPSGQAKYPIDVLVALPGGVYQYEAKEHRLVRVVAEDIREKIPNQEAFKKAAMIVLYVINKDRTSRIEWADLEIGCMGQNLYLEAAALGMGSRIIANIKGADVTKILGLKENQLLRIAQVTGPIQ